MRLIILLLLSSGCAFHRLPLERPEGDGPVVMVSSYRMPSLLKHIARHATFVIREPGKPGWTFYECCGPHPHQEEDPFEPSFGDDYWMHAVFTGEQAAKFTKCIYAASAEYGDPDYWVWPGPNSNTYVDYVLRKCDIPVDLPASCIGKDFRSVLGMSHTSGGTGIQLESPLVGLRVGLKEGIELHVLTLGFGVDFWPPALIVPFEDGRIGLADW